MKKRYRIGLILGMVLPVVLFGIGYGIRAHRLPEKKLPENVKAENLEVTVHDNMKEWVDKEICFENAVVKEK